MHLYNSKGRGSFDHLTSKRNLCFDLLQLLHLQTAIVIFERMICLLIVILLHKAFGFSVVNTIHHLTHIRRLVIFGWQLGRMSYGFT
jgi:hypothetical protein